MSDLTKNQVNILLQVIGYQTPEPDLTEITHRFNAIMEGLRSLDDLNAEEVEPWPSQPPRKENNG